MKRIFTILILVSTIACSKSKKDCHYYSTDGNYFSNKPPTEEQIKQMEQVCSCAVTIVKECD